MSEGEAASLSSAAQGGPIAVHPVDDEKKDASSLEPELNEEGAGNEVGGAGVLKEPPVLHRKIRLGPSPSSSPHPSSPDDDSPADSGSRRSRTPERTLSSEDLFLPQLGHSYMGAAAGADDNVDNKRNGGGLMNVTAETSRSEISEFSPAYSDRHAGRGGAGAGRIDEDDDPTSDDRDRHNHHSDGEEDDDDGGGDDGDDESSSNDDSSYFADPSNLPSPKSGRHHFSQSSLGSASAHHPPGGGGGEGSAARDYGRESDASLSLSEDSDDGMGHHQHHQHHAPAPAHPRQHHHHRHQHHHHHHHQQQQQQQPQQTVIFPPPPEIFPHAPITRIHSVSSLVSTNSQNSTDNEEELKDVVEHHMADDPRGSTAAVAGKGAGRGDIPTPSGRKSPVLGTHPPSRVVGPFFQSPTTHPSPPTILTTYPAVDYVYPHPQPHHLMSPDELERWTQLGGVGMPAGPLGLGSYDTGGGGSAEHLPSSSARYLDAPFSYSLDSDDGGGGGTYPPPPAAAPFESAAASAAAMGPAKERPRRPAAARGKVPSPAEGSASGPPAGSPFLPSAGGGEPGPGPSGPSFQRGAAFDKEAVPRHSGGFSARANDGDNGAAAGGGSRRQGFKVYWRRWLMLMYMSILNLLSDWTCYSVAPIALLTREAFGSVHAERLVVVFLSANAVATACEPIILSRLGLRRTVLFGALLLMIGSIVKSGGMPPIIQAKLEKGHGEWRVYLGFFLVGLSQPLYQCTPALLSASWFPEKERTMATGIALNANQLGIGFAFIFGTLLVTASDDIPAYFGLLSIISTLTFLGVLIQFDDAPPTPPSDTARAMRGTLDVGLPNIGTLFRNLGGNRPVLDTSERSSSERNTTSRNSNNSSPDSKGKNLSKAKSRSKRSHRSSERSSSSSRRPAPPSSTTTRRRTTQPHTAPASLDAEGFHALAPAPSPANWGSVGRQLDSSIFPAPSPAMPGSVAPPAQPSGAPTETVGSDLEGLPDATEGGQSQLLEGSNQPPLNPFLPAGQPYPFQHPVQQFPYAIEGNQAYYHSFGYPQGFSQPVWDPYYQQYVYFAVPPMQQYPIPGPYYQSYQNPPPPAYQRQYESPDAVLPSPAEPIDVGAEPVLTITPHHLDINIRDDQIILSTRACLSRPGFIHALVAFAVSGIVINTLSTFMDYLVRLNGAGREYTGIVGGSFQFVIMISSLIVGQFTDKTRAYYSVTVGMLVLGAFGLAECGVSLDSDSGVQLRYALVIVAALVGPLQPVSTELGVDVVYPLSENTVLVIQQLFSNLLSALFIPCFKAFKDVGVTYAEDGSSEKPEYTFSFYVLIVIHAAATVFFATFNGRYLRFEHELEKKAEEERREGLEDSSSFYGPAGESFYPSEQRPFIPPIV